MEIIVEVYNAHGQQKIYPVCEKAKLFANIAGSRELTRTTVAHIKALGYTVRVKPAEQPEVL